ILFSICKPVGRASGSTWPFEVGRRMNDYYALIARAVAGLDKSTREKGTREARHALYGRARTAQWARLRDFDPPLAESAMPRERLALEAAIRKVEAEAAPNLRVEAQVMSPAQHQILALKPVAATFHLSKRYAVGGAAVQAVSDISMRLEHGEFVAVLGRSGSGKSTLISLLGLLDRPDAGQYFFDGQDVTELDENERAFVRSHKIGFV